MSPDQRQVHDIFRVNHEKYGAFLERIGLEGKPGLYCCSSGWLTCGAEGCVANS